MLEPTNRFMLVDALRPPDGHRLDVAVGTTFTLELNALLLATVSFAVFDRIDNESGQPDPIALLESVRRHADNITVFAQAGALSGPKAHPPILAYLEDTVVPVRPPKPGFLFHPKVWALRFVDDNDEPSYRMIVLSRNLTFDSSWDTIVQLDGKRVRNAPKGNAVVGDFIASLPSQAVNPISSERSTQIGQLADDLKSVRWDHPEGVKRIAFHPMGSGSKSPSINGDRTLVMSPFLSEATVSDLGAGDGPNVLISRASSLDQIGQAALQGFDEVLVVDAGDDLLPAVGVVWGEDSPEEPSGRSEGETATAEEPDIEPPRPGVELSGLHAKVYVVESENEISFWLGSANATTAAFDGNVEFAIELGLDPKQWTIDRFLEDGGKSNLRALLQSYRPTADEPTEPDEVQQALRRVDTVLRELASKRHSVHVSPSNVGDGSYRLDLSWEDLPEGLVHRLKVHDITVTIGPATHAGLRRPYADGGAVVASTTLQAVSSFLVIEARTRADGKDVAGRTLVNAKMSGAPEDRKERLLSSLLDDPEKVLRYLLFLLAELTGDHSLLDALGTGGESFDWSASVDAPPMMETLLRALARSPESLDRVADFVGDLRSGSGESLLPPDFDEVWEPISAARERLR